MSEQPAATLVCSRCGDLVEVYGAASAIGDPFVCVQCLDPRHAEEPVKPAAALPGEPAPQLLLVES